VSFALGNPINFNDPTGHVVACDRDDADCQFHWDYPIYVDNDKYTFDTGLTEQQVEILDGASEIVLPMAFEPIDWMMTYDACTNGDCNPLMLLGLLPIIPGSVGNKIGSKIDDVIGLIPTPKGGVYTLTNNLGKVVRVGHTKDLISRAGNYRRDKNYFDLIFNAVYKTDDYATRRGLEQMLYDLYMPPLNSNRPIRIGNSNTAIYLDAANAFLNNLLGIK
jgi:hypothetical protein